MNIYLRGVLAALSAAFAYFMYIYLPGIIFNFLDPTSGPSLIETYLPFIQVQLGDYAQLQLYLSSIGFMIIGVNFAHTFAPDKTKVKAIWRLVRLFLKIVFWGLFLFTGFNTIDVSTTIINVSELGVHVNLLKLYWFMMGGVILDIVMTILDFFIAFFPPKKKEDA